ncbi:hypothetical protein EYD45_07375 [Hyunsoonleella flava]|uniref:Carrier domain-containing protein n=1 Tax=Hyunsoonleella flava TaxID=2527939 RepID=A0A4Q9FFK0_9FLAO|nr:condensation domain-containing protein [Hyunsoonleella flava]TBN04430.1 hypothetical protein EYD45_07375 [Hyunsoonleella flava]
MGTNTTKSSVEAIYPLSYMQQGMLMHHLSNDVDQGFLNTECCLKGDLKLDVFKQACTIVLKRHEVLRATIHWKNLEKPVQVIHKEKEIDIRYLDWEKLSEEEQKSKWKTLKYSSSLEKAPLEKGALLNISIIKLSSKLHKLLWPMHHILLDGWSASLLIKDILNCYNTIHNGEAITVQPLPNYKAYLNYIKSLPEENAKTFWGNYLKDFKNASLFSNIKINKKEDVQETFSTNSFSLTEEATAKLKTYCKQHKITTNIFIQSVWSLVLALYFNKTDVTHGNTVSGRSGDFASLDKMTGMFMNVQPVRGKIDSELDFPSWFASIQKLHFEARNYEHTSLDKLYSYCDWPEHATMFDSLIVFENYPTINEKKAGLEAINIKSGLTSTYSVTLAILPNNCMEFVLTTSTTYINTDTAQWIVNTLEKAISLIILGEVTTYKALKSHLEPFKQFSSTTETASSATNQGHNVPKNKTELQLLQIWEHVLGINNISTTSNFFELGGKSLIAVKLFSIINKTFKTKLSATALLEYPSIELLSNHILSGTKSESFQFIVPIRSSGDKKPIFCLHGGGGYVIFFNPLVQALENDIPVYALQPAGINSSNEMHNSLEEMAIDYAKEIKAVQPSGPYNLLSYCFSTGLGIEIANIFKAEGEETNLVVIDSIIKQEDFTSPDRIKMRISGFLGRIRKNPVNAIKLMVLNQYYKFIHPIVSNLFASKSDKHLEKLKLNLRKIYIKYGWDKNHPDNVLLILSDKADKNLNHTYINSWKSITDGKVNVKHTNGKHHQLFTVPYIYSIAKTIEAEIYKH